MSGCFKRVSFFQLFTVDVHTFGNGSIIVHSKDAKLSTNVCTILGRHLPRVMIQCRKVNIVAIIHVLYFIKGEVI